MNDRELLELAAKAAGIPLGGWEPCPGGFFTYSHRGSDERKTWLPLTDDGDALRLAVRLEIEVRVFNGAAHAGKQDKFWRTEPWFPDGDIYAATRRAIVRAAAAIGKEM